MYVCMCACVCVCVSACDQAIRNSLQLSGDHAKKVLPLRGEGKEKMTYGKVCGCA